jgi:hypothetical protein
MEELIKVFWALIALWSSFGAVWWISADLWIDSYIKKLVWAFICGPAIFIFELGRVFFIITNLGDWLERD